MTTHIRARIHSPLTGANPGTVQVRQLVWLAEKARYSTSQTTGGAVYTGTNGAVSTGTGGAVCKGATPSVEQ